MASNCFPNLRAKDKDKGTSSQTLIYYSSVAGGRPKLNILAEYVDANDHDKELPRIASNCLRFLPPHHYHFSFTANMRMFACIIEEPFIYCAIADEALNRSNVIAFLEQLRHEFLKYAKDKGVLVDNHDHDHDQSKLKTHSLDKHFKPVFKRLVSPLTGMTQHEKCRIAEEARARQRAEARAAAEAKAEADARAKAEAETETGFEPKSVASIQEDQRVQGDIEVGFESVSPDDASAYERYDPSATIEKCSSGSRSPSAPLINKDHEVRGSKQRKSKPHTKTRGIDGIVIAEEKGVVNGDVNREENGAYTMVNKKPCTTVKCIILIDVIICVILFGIWLGICKGISCTKSK